MSLLSKDKNPAYEFCEVKLWLAYRNEQIVGRIAGIINHNFNEKWQKQSCRFGWIDFIDDDDVSKALLDTVETWAKTKGMHEVHGPLGFSDLDPEGMLIEGFEELSNIATIYNYPYYPMHLNKLGYNKDADWVEYEIRVPEKIPEKIDRIAKIVLKKHNLRVLPAVKIKEIKHYAIDIFELFNLAYQDLYGFVPLTKNQIDFYIKQYISLANPKLICLILDSNDQVAAFGLTFPSMSKAFQKAKGRLLPWGWLHMIDAIKHEKTVDLYLLAVRPEFQDKGVNSLLFTELLKNYIDNKFVKAESNPELETNHRVQAQWKYFEHRQHKRRRCFIKQLC
jgi:GNAT superfamily N-acetyltransferase